ncbi:MAG: ParA family protein [Actinobacteria bacterium]|nr:ParA family protein [Actinomycetota bacterium]
MTAPVVTFFNNKGGVGKTSLVYHLAWIYAVELRRRVVAVDLDPQANLTAAFLNEDELEALWPAAGPGQTVFGNVSPLLRGIGDIAATSIREIDDRLALAPGDLSLSRFEDELSSQWPDCLDGKERAFRVISAFRRLIVDGAQQFEADLVLVDVGPNLGAINRAALVAADHVVVPLAPDLFSLQGLRNLGPTLRRWREEWRARVPKNPDPDLELPPGGMRPAGYVLQQHGVRLGRAVGAYQRWMDRIPGIYRTDVLGQDGDAPALDDDPNCLAQLKHYRSLIPMAQDVRKPVFALKPADGAFGGHQAAVQASRRDFIDLAFAIYAAVRG